MSAIVLKHHKNPSYLVHIGQVRRKVANINPFVPDAHYSECQGKPFSLQIQQLEVDLKLNCGFLFFAPSALIG